MLTDGMIHSTFKIKYGDSVGSAIAVYFKKQHWLFTAKHILNTSVPRQIEIFHQYGWAPVNVSEHKVSPTHDVAVLRCNISGLRPGNPFPLAGHMQLGQDVCFLGFPLGLHYSSSTLFPDRPIPLYKRGYLSGMQGDGESFEWVVDALNNQGFSGGPVFALPMDGRPEDISLVGIVSSYIYRESFVFTKDPTIDPNETVSSTAFVKENPGIMIVSPIKFCLTLIAGTDWEAEARTTPRLT